MIDNYIVNYDKEITKLHYSDIENVNAFMKKIKFYNPNVEIEPLQKFWYKINNAKIIKKSVNNLEIVLSQNDEKLIKSISILDDKINIILKEKDNSFINNKSIINKANYPPIMLLFFDDTSMFYDEAHNEKNYYDLKIDTKISLFIELESVIINGINCNKKWKILQLKETNMLNNKTNFFSPNIIRNNIPPAPLLPQISQISQIPQIISSIPNILNISKPNNSPIKQEYSRSMINVNDIRNVLSKLRKKPDIIQEEKKQLPFIADLCSMKTKLKKAPIKEYDYKILFEEMIEKYKDLDKFEI